MMGALGGYLWLIVGAILPALILIAWKYIYNFHWFDYWFTRRFMFLLGKSKIAELSENTGGKKGNSSCDAEEQLCDAYAPHIIYPTQEEFNKNFTYLHKAGDAGRRPTPKGVWAFLIALVVAEGLGFSYLLGTIMTSGEASETMGTYLMWAIVFVISGILVLLTDFGGHQLYRTNLIKQCMKKRGEKRGAGTSISSQTIDGDEDNSEPSYVRTLNRMSNYQSANYSFLIAAGILIALIAIGSTYLRYYHFDNSLTSETVGAPASNPFSSAPPELAIPQGAANEAAQQDLKKGTAIEFGVGFILLAVIFVFTQIVAIIMGYKYGFAGEFSKDAYKITRGFSSYDAMLFYYKPRIQIAQARLKTLQNNLARKFEDHDFPLDMTFLELLERNAARSNRTKAPPITKNNPTNPSPNPVEAMPRGAPVELKKFCENCGNPAAVTAKFCGGCGTQIA